MLCFASKSLRAQEIGDLYVYGYFQGLYRISSETIGAEESNANSFSLQQLNILFSKSLGKSFSGFVDVEALNSFSTVDGTGSLKFSEAWVRYRFKRQLSFKLGLQVPVFNNLNHIKNRSPLLPYIYRPAVYELAYSAIAPILAFVPQHVFLSASGTLVEGKTKFDYTFYVGNEEESTSGDVRLLSSLPSGSDTTRSKLFGGRVGLRKQGVKAGISATFDHTSKQIIGFDFSLKFRDPIRRHRVGVDLSFPIKRFFVETEAIWVLHRITDKEELMLDELRRTVPVLTEDLNKFFAYGLLGYRFGESTTVYASFTHLEDRSNLLMGGGAEYFDFGVAYKPIDALSLKAQLIRANLKKEGGLTVHYDGLFLMIGVSLLF